MTDYGIPQFEAMRLEIACLKRERDEARQEVERLRMALAEAQNTAYSAWVAATGYPIAEWVYEYEEHAWLRDYAARRVEK